MTYCALDFLQVDELFTPEERMVRDTAREFVSNKIIPKIGGDFAAGRFPREMPRELGQLGFLGSSLQGYGCNGASSLAYGIICRELERGDSGIRSFCSVQSSLCMYPIWAFGDEAQKQRYLPRMAAGETIGCFCLTEPDIGSNPKGMRSTARAVKEGFILNGTKRWITNGSIADVAVVWATLNDVVRGFLVPTDSVGFSARDLDNKWSLRASVTSEIVLDQCWVAQDALLPGCQGLKGPLSCLTEARYGIAWGAVGAMQACYDEALSYARTRVQFSKPIASYQLVQNKLADMVQEISKAQLLAYQLGQLKEMGRLRPQQVSLAKRNNVFWAREIARTARDILGANGITHDYQCGRHMLNMESVFTYEGTHDIHALVIGQDITGIAAFE